jgi:hypothetical protein
MTKAAQPERPGLSIFLKLIMEDCAWPAARPYEDTYNNTWPWPWRRQPGWCSNSAFKVLILHALGRRVNVNCECGQDRFASRIHDPFARSRSSRRIFVVPGTSGLYFFSVTISEKSAMLENSRTSVCSNPSRWARRFSSSTITITLSKNASIAGRSCEISISACS